MLKKAGHHAFAIEGVELGSAQQFHLSDRLGVRRRANLPALTIPLILMWADTHFQRTGMWPTRRSGAVIDAPGETWRAIDLALNRGNRGLPSGRSLPQLFAEHISCAGQNRGSCLESIIVVQRAAPWRVVSKWQVRHAAKQAP